jgi:formylglycine-generating enzyme required for sulfatase activity
MRSLLFVSLLIFPFLCRGQHSEGIKTQVLSIPGTEVSFEMALIPGGALAVEADSQEQVLEVDSFWIGVHEVTRDMYDLFQHREYDNDESAWTEGEFSADAVTRPSPPYTDITFGMGSTDKFPSVSMTQQAALFFCYWLYTKTGEFYRLPTEAEWTYACLAGGSGKYPPEMSAEDLDEYAWHYQNSEERYREVGKKKANPWGLYDMIGNVAEWTIDQYAENYGASAAEDPKNPWLAPDSRYGRTVMGGSFDDFPEDCHCRSRVKSTAQWQKRDPQIPKSLWWNTDSPFVGFRLVKPTHSMNQEEIEAFFAKAIKW